MKLAPISTYDVAVQQAWLEDEAAKGRFLDCWGGFGVFFKRGEPKAVRYRLEPLRRRESIPDQEQREAYAAQGWTYVDTAGKVFHIWRCDDPAAPELDTDPEVQAMAYDCLRRRLRRADRLIAAIWLGLAAVVLEVYGSDPGRFLTHQIENDYPWWQALPLFAMVLFALWQTVHRARTLRRFLRTLRAGVPAPRRRPYRLSRFLTAVAMVLYSLYMVTLTASLFRPDTRPFLPAETFDEPVPCVALADVGAPLAIPWDNWLTRAQWWVIQQGPGEVRAESRYYDLRFPALAEPLTREARERFSLRPMPAENLDGAWWAIRDDGLQILTVRRGGRVLTVCYDGGEDLRTRVDDYAALLVGD